MVTAAGLYAFLFPLLLMLAVKVGPLYCLSARPM